MLKLKLWYFGHLMQRADSLKRPWCWERLKVGGEGNNRGWDGWMASPTQWTWVWVNSGSWWWAGRPGMLQSTGLQRVGQNWETELNWQAWKLGLEPTPLTSTAQQPHPGPSDGSQNNPTHHCTTAAVTRSHSQSRGQPYIPGYCSISCGHHKWRVNPAQGRNISSTWL